MPNRRKEYHIVVLGAGGVGKSCLTAQFVQNVWIESYDPTIEDSHRKQLQIDGRPCILEILDTAGTEQFTAMRELYMKTGHGFLLVFSITSLASMIELQELRDQIVRIKDDPMVPLVIVGNKCDLADDRAVSKARASAVAKSWNDASYYETSARARRNVDEAFIDLCRQMIRRDIATGHVKDMEQGNNELARLESQHSRSQSRHRSKRKNGLLDRSASSRCQIL